MPVPRSVPACGSEVRSAAQPYTVEALEGLAQIARNSDNDAAKVAAWKAILDRGHGRPVVSIDARPSWRLWRLRYPTAGKLQ